MKPSFSRVSLLCLLFVAIPVFGQFFEQPTPPPGSLKELDVPAVIEKISGFPLVDRSADGANGFIKDEAAAIRLGKAFYWDTQSGSDGVACGTCHYHAGADAREKNQLSPGLKGGNNVFDPTGSGGLGPNHTLTALDYPFHKLANPTDRDSAILFDTDDVTSSQGVHSGDFVDIVLSEPDDNCNVTPDPFGFSIDGINVRRVEPRNTPTVINAAFNHRNFWDGRANNVFNGADHNGPRNSAARIHENQGGNLVEIQVAFENSALASQAVGPPNSDFEMACTGRIFPNIGQKLLSLTPLGQQKVHHKDSVLGSLANKQGKNKTGLNTDYATMIQAAFADRFWDSNLLVDGEFTQMEANFALFWGLAIQAYETTLLSDDTPFDQWAEAAGGNSTAVSNHKGILTEAQMRGMQVFFSNTPGERGNCSTCHQGPTFTTAAFPFTEPDSGEFPEVEQLVERMRMGDGINIAENLFRFFITGEGTVGGVAITGPEGSGGPPARAGTWELPGYYPATVSGDITVAVAGCDYTKVTSFMMNMDTLADPDLSGPPLNTVDPVPPPGPPPYPDTSTRDAVFTMSGDGCPFPIQVTIVDGGPGNIDTATIFQVIVPRLPPFFPGDKEKPPVLGAPLAAGPILSVTPGIIDTFRLNSPTLYDTGFYNIGVRPTFEDPGVGAEAMGFPLSFTRQWINNLVLIPPADDLSPINMARVIEPYNWFGDAVFFPGGFSGPSWLSHEQQLNPFLDDVPFCQAPGFGGGIIEGINNEQDCLADNPANTWVTFVNMWANLMPVFAPTMYTFPFPPGRGDEAVPAYNPFGPFPNTANYDAIMSQPTAVDGSFKTSSLRNVTLTAPYFHNGGQATLAQVVEFYNRGGDFAIENLGSLSPNIHPLSLDQGQRDDLVAFLGALTDDRVRCESAPFDHPQISIPNGAKGGKLKDDGTGNAKENFETIPAVGQNGRPKDGLPCLDNEGFLD